jgi:MFS-type transporter involved in bile tolerance (Atg22 family)
MLRSLLAILFCQLAGELIQRTTVSATLLGSSIIVIAIPALTMEWLERRRAREDGVLTRSPSIGARRRAIFTRSGLSSGVHR